MSGDSRTLKPARVTLLWRRYGTGIEWTATIDPPPFDCYEHMFGWQHERADDEIPDPLYRAAFRLGEQISRLSLFANPLVVLEQPSIREAPAAGDLDETDGVLHEDGLEIHFYGACPVQGVGILAERFCYYRARGRGWSFTVWAEGVTQLGEHGLPELDAEWEYRRPDVYAHPDGGWLHRDESIKNLREAIAAWRTRSIPKQKTEPR